MLIRDIVFALALAAVAVLASVDTSTERSTALCEQASGDDCPAPLVQERTP